MYIVLPPGTLFKLWTQKTKGHGTPTVGECDIKSESGERSACCWQQLATTADVTTAVYSRRRSLAVDRTRRPAVCTAHGRFDVMHRRAGLTGVS